MAFSACWIGRALTGLLMVPLQSASVVQVALVADLDEGNTVENGGKAAWRSVLQRVGGALLLWTPHQAQAWLTMCRRAGDVA